MEPKEMGSKQLVFEFREACYGLDITEDKNIETELLLRLSERDALNAENAALKEAARWIDIEDTLPELGQEVLAYGEYGIDIYLFDVEHGIYGLPGHFIKGDCCYCDDLAYWMPLPQPPEVTK